MFLAVSDPAPDTRPGPLRSPRGRGRPYPANVVASVRTLIATTGLRFEEIAERTGVHEATVGRWVRRFGWSRPDRRGPTAPAVSDGRRRPPYGEADHEAARALIEGSRLGVERIGLRLGIGTATLFRWQKRYRWSRPGAPTRSGPQFARYRRRGKPYAADAVGVAKLLVTTSLLPQARIAAQAGVSQATISNWIRRRGWTRPVAKPWSHRFAAARRTAPTVERGDRRGRAYGEATVTEAERLYRQTELPTAIIAARVRVSAVTIARWAKEKGWIRPRDLPDAHGRPVRRRRR